MIRLIRAELLKFLTTRLWWGLLIGVVAVSAAFPALLAALAGRGGATAEGIPGLDDPATVRGVYTAALSITYLFALAVGVIAMAGEYRHQTITAAVLSTPRRFRVVVAKLAAMIVIGGGYGVASVAVSVLVAAPVIAARGHATLLFRDGVPRALGLAVLAVALWAVLGLGVGTLIRNQVAALLVSIGVAWLGQQILTLILAALHWTTVLKYLPSSATSALVSPSTDTGNSGLTFAYLPWWGGALVLLGYAAISGALGVGLTLRRDIS